MNKDNKHDQLVKTARITGIWYLVMAISGMLGFLVLHPKIFDSDPQVTLTNLTDFEFLSRARVLMELAIIVSQALTATWFFKLFRNTNPWAAWALGAGGMMNAVAIMISAIAMASLVGIAGVPISNMDDKLLYVTIFQDISTNAWGVGSLFFGLWLLPMGYIVIQSKRMPIWLGRVIFLGGIGYLVSTFLKYAGIDFDYRGLLVLPATIGEFWIIGYLLIFGIRPVQA